MLTFSKALLWGFFHVQQLLLHAALRSQFASLIFKKIIRSRQLHCRRLT